MKRETSSAPREALIREVQHRRRRAWTVLAALMTLPVGGAAIALAGGYAILAAVILALVVLMLAWAVHRDRNVVYLDSLGRPVRGVDADRFAAHQLRRAEREAEHDARGWA